MHFLKRRNGVGGYWIEYINWVKIKTNEGALISESHLESNSLIYGVGACAVIGDNNFFSAFTGIEHHCKIGSGCTFGPGVITSSRVYIGDKVKFGTGIFIEPGINIGDNSIVASGSILTIDVPADSICKSSIETTIRAK